MDNIFAYLRSRWQLLLFYGIVLAILLLTAFLGSQDMGLALYAAAMLTFMLVLLLLAEGSRFCGRLRLLQRLLQRLGALPSGLPRPGKSARSRIVRGSKTTRSASNPARRRPFVPRPSVRAGNNVA